MSFHRENIIWKSADGTWSRGFYETYSTGGYGDEDYDPEWDVDYNFDNFEWVSTGHATEDAANRSWDGSNPGGHESVTGEHPDDAKHIAALDDMAAKLCEEGHYGYSGPKRRRRLAPMFREMAALSAEQFAFARGDYANNNVPEMERLEQRIREVEPLADADELAERDKAMWDHVNSLDEMAARWRLEGVRNRDRMHVVGAAPAIRRRREVLEAVEDHAKTLRAAMEQSKKSKVPSTVTAKTAKSAAGRREKDAGVPTTNGGRFAADQRAESGRPLDPPF